MQHALNIYLFFPYSTDQIIGLLCVRITLMIVNLLHAVELFGCEIGLSQDSVD
jgi:hypothetical protein